jgi:hypothetical protein
LTWIIASQSSTRSVEARDRADPGIVDNDVEAAEAPHSQIDQRCHVVSPAHVGGLPQGLSARTDDGLADLRQLLLAASAQHHRGTSPSQQPCRRRADAAAGPRDHYNLILHAHSPCCSVETF